MASWLWVGFSIRRTCQVPLPMLAAWVSVSDVEPAADLIRQATCSTDVPSDWNRLHVSMQWKFMDTLREQNNFWCTVITISKCCNPKKIEKVRFTTTLQFRSGERERENQIWRSDTKMTKFTSCSVSENGPYPKKSPLFSRKMISKLHDFGVPHSERKLTSRFLHQPWQSYSLMICQKKSSIANCFEQIP